jgi:hypothetical protein
MIIVTDTRGGYLLSRDDDPPTAEPLFVAASELPALLVDLLARETGTTDTAGAADEWDFFAFLCGNYQVMAVRP